MSTRISTEQVYNSSQQHVSDAREKEVSSSEKAASMKEINRPSDNPAGWVRAQNLKDDMGQRETINRNSSLASHVLSMSENVLTQIQEYAQRAHELALSASSSTGGTAQVRANLLAEVRTLYESTLRAANTRYGGKTLMAGYQTDKPAFDSQGKYVGDQGRFQLEIGRGLVVPINLNAEELIQGKGLPNGVNIPEVLNRLAVGLDTSDTEMIRSTLDDLLQAGDQLSIGRSQIGARMNEIERVSNSSEKEKIENLDDISKIEESDVVKAFSDLTRDQTVLRAAISTSQKILTEDPINQFFK